MINKALLKQKVKEKTGSRALLPQIANVCGVSRPTVFNWFSGKTKMPVDYVAIIQRAYAFTDNEIVEIFLR